MSSFFPAIRKDKACSDSVQKAMEWLDSAISVISGRADTV